MPNHREHEPLLRPDADEIPRRPTCDVVEAWLEPFLDEQLDHRARHRLERHLASCGACSAELELATRIRQGLRSLSAPPCPDRVTEAVLAQIPASDARGWWRRLSERFSPAIWLPALACLFIASLLSLNLILSPSSGDRPSEEVAQAEAEVKLALAYLGQISRATGETVGQDVLGDKVALPVARSVRDIVTNKPPAGARGDENAS